MRNFDDIQGNHWQAALLEASYGAVLVVFSRDGGDEVLKNQIDAPHLMEAQQLLADMDEAGLRTLLAEAAPWG